MIGNKSTSADHPGSAVELITRSAEFDMTRSDHVDAMTLANILRTDGHAHRALPADTELARAIGAGAISPGRDLAPHKGHQRTPKPQVMPSMSPCVCRPA
jgi:hypothetical protein